MKLSDGVPQFRENIATRFDDEHELRRILDFVFPPVDAARAGKNVDARGQPLFNQVPRKPLRLLFGFTRGEDDDLVSHRMRISFREDAEIEKARAAVARA